jgi:hypothetical protein
MYRMMSSNAKRIKSNRRGTRWASVCGIGHHVDKKHALYAAIPCPGFRDGGGGGVMGLTIFKFCSTVIWCMGTPNEGIAF